MRNISGGDLSVAGVLRPKEGKMQDLFNLYAMTYPLQTGWVAGLVVGLMVGYMFGRGRARTAKRRLADKVGGAAVYGNPPRN